MAVIQTRDTRSFEAGEDLSAAQFKFVTLESDGQVDLADAAGENCIGVLLNNPDAAGKRREDWVECGPWSQQPLLLSTDSIRWRQRDPRN